MKWPFYLLKWLPNFEVWMTPFIMGTGAYITHIIQHKLINDPIMYLNSKLPDDKLEIEKFLNFIDQSSPEDKLEIEKFINI